MLPQFFDTASGGGNKARIFTRLCFPAGLGSCFGHATIRGHMIRNLLTLSIVIPVYNEESYLDACLDSIARQSVTPDEVLIVNNNSTDESMEIAERYPFVRMIAAKQQGIAYARNQGFDNAGGNIIGRIDADTILPTSWVADVKEFYSDPANGKVALTGGATFRNMPFPRLAGWLQQQLAFRLDRLALGHHMLWGSNMALLKATWQEVKATTCNDNAIHEDIDLSIHLHQAGYKVRYLPDFKVDAILKRVLTEQESLYQDLLRWPRTLKRHQKPGWVLVTLGAAVVYGLALAARILSRTKRFFGSKA